MKKHLHKCLFIAFSAMIAVCMMMCKPLERINAIRITAVNITSDSLSATISGEIIDNNQNQEIQQYGFCLSSVTADPQIGNPDSDTLNLGKPTDKSSFSAVIDSLIPNRNYYVKPYMIISGSVVYGATNIIQTKKITLTGTSMNVSSILFDSVNVYVNGFVNKSVIETFPVTLLKYGTVVSASPDSTVSATSGISIEVSPVLDGKSEITDTYTISSIPNIANPNNKGIIYVWLFIEFSLKNRPGKVQRAYTKRKELIKL